MSVCPDALELIDVSESPERVDEPPPVIVMVFVSVEFPEAVTPAPTKLSVVAPVDNAQFHPVQ